MTATLTAPPEAVEAWANARPAVRNRARWQIISRPKQQTPEGNWNIWLVMSGRGWGKTRTAAEDMAYFGITHPGSRLAIVAPTYSDARDTCVEGESGLLACLPDEEVATWNRSLGELILNNGTRYKLFSGDEPDRLRGPQHHRAWCDELAAFRYTDTWDMLMMGLRLGDHPQCVVTTTPRPSHLLRSLVARSDVVVTRGSTFDNADNLAPAALESLRRRYSGTRMGLQELEGQLLEEAEGALWQREWIESSRVTRSPQKGYRVKVVALDPADGKDESDEQGRCFAGLGLDNKLYVIESKGTRLSVRDWLRDAVLLAHEEKASLVIEINHGGEYLIQLLEQVMKDLGVRVAYTKVWASKGKTTRAEPVAMLYEQGASTGNPVIHHIGNHPQLEDEQCNFTGRPGEPSPGELDALVWAITHLMGYSREPRGFDDDKAVPYSEKAVQGGAVAWQ
jgi:phage terminase large subunit-like protein